MSEKRGEVKWMGKTKGKEDWNVSQTVADPRYSRVGERIRHITPSALQCSMFCGGKQCKYDNPTKWKAAEMAIRGLYSSWITETILAMARPSSFAVKEYNVIQQFRDNNITAIMNLQHPGEHSSCGFGLEEESGFSYNPQEFMDNDVFFYNFGWDDYGVRALQSILDMVKVMDFALMNGKVAIHCHAGLGRTGVLIACYFVYSQRMKADEAINTVRKSRPKAIQTRGQIACVRDFEKYLRPMWVIFANTRRSDECKPFSLDQFLRRQTHILHGEEERDLRYVPKIVFVTCQRLLDLSGIEFDLRAVSMLKRHGFTKHHESSDSITIQQGSSSNQSCSSSINPQRKSPPDINDHNEQSEVVNPGQAVSDESFPENAAMKRDERNSDSGVVLCNSFIEDGLSLGEDGQIVAYFDDTAADPTEYGGVEDIKPERTIRLSLSECSLDKEVRFSADILEDNSKDEGSSWSKQDRSPRHNSLPLTKPSGSSLNSPTESSKPSRFTQKKEKIELNSSDHSVDSSTSVSEASSSSASYSIFDKAVDVSKEAAIDPVLERISRSLSTKSLDMKTSNALEQYKMELNNSDSTWKILNSEKDAYILCCLLWFWLEHLKDPVITSEDLVHLSKNEEDTVKAFQTLPRDKWKTFHVILLTFLKITSKAEKLQQKAIEKITKVLLKDSMSAKKGNSEKTFSKTTSSKQEESNEYSTLSMFILRLCKSELFET